MGRAISVKIGEHFFAKKGDLIKYIQELVARYQIKDYLNDEDFQFCLELFESHTDYPQKLAPGVERIQLLIQEEGTHGFQIHKKDGTSDNISWRDCVANRK